MSNPTNRQEQIKKKTILWEIYHELFTNQIKKGWNNFVKYLKTSLYVVIEPSKFFDDEKRGDLYDCVQYTVHTLGITAVIVVVFSVFGLEVESGLNEVTEGGSDGLDTIMQLLSIVYYLILLSIYIWIAKKFRGIYRDLPKESISVGFIYYYNLLFFIGTISIIVLSIFADDFSLESLFEDKGADENDYFLYFTTIGLLFAFYFFSRMGRLKNIFLYIIFVLFIAAGVLTVSAVIFPLMFN